MCHHGTRSQCVWSQEWVKINRAHEVLADDEKRRTYDSHGEEVPC